MEISLLFIFLAVIAFFLVTWLTYKLASLRADLKWQKNLVSLRKEIANQQRAGIKGKVSETFAPFLEGFPFKPSECKFLGDPIDYVVFEGLDERDVKSVHFVEVKEGTSQLSKHQKQIRDLIDNLDSENVTFKEFRFKSE
jgi:predicted Holliday junction resolvase-like endonuclease